MQGRGRHRKRASNDSISPDAKPTVHAPTHPFTSQDSNINMKLISILAAFAGFCAAGNNAFYSADRDVTCTGAENGDILCEQGHIDDAPTV